MPEDVERMVTKLEEKAPEVKEPWALATWMKKKGYKMPEKKEAEEEEKNPLEPKAPSGQYKKEKMQKPGDVFEIRPRTPLHKETQKLLKAEEEDKTGKDDYTSWQREKHEEKSKPLLTKIKEKLLGAEDDMLVYPDEFKMGMKEEMEHAKTVEHDKETIKKIVLDHLKEDPHYYTKLGTAMKAEEERRQSSIRRSMKRVPHEKDIIRHLQTVKAEEEDGKRSKVPVGPIDVSKGAPPGFKKVEGWGIPKKNKAEEDKKLPEKELYFKKPESVHYITPTAPKYQKAEEDETSDYIKSLSKRKMTPGWKPPAGPKPKTEADLPSERLSAEEGKEVDHDALNELYQFMQWMMDKGFKADDKDKFEQYMDQYEVEKFAEEKQDPAKFHAEPK